MAARGKSISKTLVWILLGLLIVGLAGFGAINVSGGMRTIGAVGDEEIGIDEYARALREELRAIEAQTGRSMSLAEARQLGLDRQVLGRLATAAALDDEAGRLGLSVGDEVLAAQLAQIRAFQGPDGRFDREAYRFALQNAGLSEAAFEEDLRDETARTLLQAAVMTGTPAPEAAIAALLDHAGERRDLTWVPLSGADLAAPLPAPDDKTLRDFYEANIDRFTLPEARRITYAWLRPDAMLDRIELDEDALRDAYAAAADRYDRPERRLVERLAFADEAAAQAAWEALEAGETDFETLVQERGLTLSDVDLGDVAQDDLGAAGAAVFAAEVGAVTPPAPSALGPALFRVNAVLPAEHTPFEEARDELRTELAMDRARRLIEQRAQELEDLLAGGATLEELAKEGGMELGTLDYAEGVEEGIAAFPAFREAAAAVTAEDYPQITPLSDGGIFALRLDEVIPPRPQPFDEVAGRVAAEWEREATRAQLRARAEELLEALRGGEDFAALGLEARSEAGRLRSDFIEGAPASLLETAFAMEPGELALVEGENGVALLRLDAVRGPDPDDPEVTAFREAMRQQIAAGLSEDLFAAYVRDIQARAGVQLDQGAINAVHAQFQ